MYDEYAYTCRALTTMAFKLDLAIDIHTNFDRDIVNYAQRTLRWTVFTALLESINIWPNLRLKQRPLVGVSNAHLVGLQEGIKNHVDALYLQRQQKRQAQIWLIHFDLHKKTRLITHTYSDCRLERNIFVLFDHYLWPE